MVSDERTAELEQADSELLDLLKRQGDQPEVIRPVDVRFKGAKADLERFRETLGRGWRVLQLIDEGDGSWALDLQREQAADAASIKALTDGAIGIEMRYDVEYDGWGCVVQAAPDVKP